MLSLLRTTYRNSFIVPSPFPLSLDHRSAAQPLPLQSASGASDDDSASISSSSLDLSSSSPPPATCRSPLNRTLGGSGRGLIITGALRRGSRSSIDNLASSFISKGRSLEHDEEEEDERGGATGGSESALVPFSLEEITCVASETVSASSSPFRWVRAFQRAATPPPMGALSNSQASVCLVVNRHLIAWYSVFDGGFVKIW